MNIKKGKKWLALTLSAAIIAGSLSGPAVVGATESITETPVLNAGAPNYIYEGNMVTNSSFTDNNGWTFAQAGYGNNNGHNGNGDRHFYINAPTGKVSQQFAVPYTGYYKAGLWVASAGTGCKFGVRNVTTGEVQQVEAAVNTKYNQYNNEIWLNQGDLVEVFVTGGTSWVNGDDISLEFNTGKYENMVVNPAFSGDTSWIKTGNAGITDNKAVLGNADDSISQSIYIPQNGPYYATVVLENAENATVTFGSVTSSPVNGNQSVTVKCENLQIPGPQELRVSGKADVKSAEVKFDLSNVPNQPPTASNVTINGDCTADLVLESTYDFMDADGQTEGNSTYQWLISDTQDGTYTPIDGETGRNLALKKEWADKFIKFQVTPVDQFAKAGDPVSSAPSGPVDLNVISNPGFEQDQADWSKIVIYNTNAYAGLCRGTVNKGITATQNITIPRSAYYNFEAYVKYSGSSTGKLEVRDEAGNVISSVTITPGTDWTKFTMADIPLEKGQKIILALVGATDQSFDIDSLTLKRDREAGNPGFTNITKFVTTPESTNTVIDSQNNKVTLTYPYGTDISKITLQNIEFSDGSTPSINIGDVMDFSTEYKFTMTGGDGVVKEWTIVPVVSEKKVLLESSNKTLQDTFNWAANKMDQFVMTGKTGPINVPQASGQSAAYIPSYWAGYYDRTAFYGRDFLHQTTGAEIAGLAAENFSMFKAFAAQCTEERQWYTVWAMNFDGSVYTMDYINANNFVREVPAQFEMVEKAYKQFLWSGDKRYIEDESLWNFYTNIMTKYADSHDANGNGVVQETGNGIFSGSCTYNERGRHVIEAGDAIGSQYQATLAYAGMLKARGEQAESERWYQKAQDLKTYFNDTWSVSDNMSSDYVCAWGPNGEKYSDFSKETSWFMPMKLITEPGERNTNYINFILSNLGNGIGTASTAPANIEAYTYIPDMLFPYNRSDDAWKWMQYIASMKDKPHERPIQGTNGNYPEISFTFVAQTIEGMMGVEPNAAENLVATSPRLPSDVPDITAKYMQVGEYELDLTHTGNTESELKNHADKALNWEARFYGDYKLIQFGDKMVPAQQKEINGVKVSYATTTVDKNGDMTARAVPQTEADLLLAAKAVEDKITAIGTVTLSSEAAITDADTAYNALSDDAKALVTNLSVLQNAKSRLAELKKEAEENNRPKTVSAITITNAVSEIKIGDILDLGYTFEPGDAADSSVTWGSSNGNVATVSQSGKVTGIGEGTVRITCKANDSGQVTAYVDIKVTRILVSAITLNLQLVSLETGGTTQLTAAILPENADNKNVIWSSSDSNIVTVSETGAVQAKNAGTATITATAQDGSNVSATCRITVIAAETKPESKPQVKPEVAKLEKAIKSADKIIKNKSDYVHSTIVKLEAVLKQAKSLLAKENITQRKVDDMTDKLLQRIKGIQSNPVTATIQSQPTAGNESRVVTPVTVRTTAAPRTTPVSANEQVTNSTTTSDNQSVTDAANTEKQEISEEKVPLASADTKDAKDNKDSKEKSTAVTASAKTSGMAWIIIIALFGLAAVGAGTVAWKKQWFKK